MQSLFHSFGAYRLDPALRSLSRGSEFVPLTGREFDTLLTLVQHAGAPVDKETFRKEVWAGVEVADVNLRKQIEAVRKKLGKDPDGQDYIRTVRNRGYLLSAVVATAPEDPGVERPDPAGLAADPVALMPAARRGFRRVLPLSVSGALLVLAAIGALFRGAPNPVPGPPRPFGRLLARSTSENRSPERIRLGNGAGSLAISPRGDKLYAADAANRVLSIVTLKDRSVRAIALPLGGGPLAMSPQGLLYIGSEVQDGVMVFDTAKGRLRPKIVQAGGQVRDMALTPDGKKLFLAMSEHGTKRLLTETGRIDQVSNSVCPEHVALDRQGKFLYVAYQCKGPGGESRHDSIEIFDPVKEISLGIIGGPPMVGGPTAVSPSGRLILQDGRDACYKPMAGCSEVPSHIFHLIRPSDHQLMRTLEYPADTTEAQFLDDSRFFIAGYSISVIDSAKYTALERWDAPEDRLIRAVLAPDGGAAYFVTGKEDSILVFRMEPAGCGPTRRGLRLFYSGDGSAGDGAGQADLSAQGPLLFRPGRVGQAFYLDGSNSLVAPWTSYYTLGNSDITLALYIKATDVHGESVLIDRVSEGPLRGVRLLESADGHLIFQSWPGIGVLVSSTLVKPNVWYHVAVTKTDREVTMFVNGEPEAHGAPPAPYEEEATRPLFLGADHLGKPSFRGLLDEIAFYDRALSVEEVRAMFTSREVGPCKL